MGAKTGISWTDSTWNPVRGCSRVSDGCKNCYAEQVAARFSGPDQPYEGLAEFRVIGAGTERERREAHWTGKVRMVPEHLEDPLRWKRPRRIFVNSMSDLFHESLPDEEIDRVFDVMARAHWHTFQILTKRAARLPEYFQRWALRLSEYPHIQIGVSVEHQTAADERIPHLLLVPAAVRFLSCEPLLGPLDLILRGSRIPDWDEDWKYDTLTGKESASPRDDSDPRSPKLDWVIVGGESGPNHRPCQVAWIEDLVRQCQKSKVPVFVKQDSGPKAGKQGRITDPFWIKQFPQ